MFHTFLYKRNILRKVYLANLISRWNFLLLKRENRFILYLQSTKEIDQGYRKGQTLLTTILLAGSILGLLITLLLMLPAKELRSNRSAKINIWFCFTLLLASTFFLLQHLLVKEDNTGIIQLVRDIYYL